MKRCVIHFGMYKTGSSSIQHSFWQRLNNPEWKYLDLGCPNHSGPVSMVVKQGMQRRHLIEGISQETFLKRKNNRKNKLLQELDSDAENLLISAEWLSSNEFGVAELAEFRDLLGGQVDSICVAGYVRPPKSYMESCFQENVKHAHPTFDLDKLYPAYQNSIGKLDQVFGVGNVAVWKFDPSSFPNNCVVQDFCRRLGIGFPVDLMVRLNESLSLEATALLYTYRKFTSGFGIGKTVMRQNDLLVDRLATLRGGKWQFSGQTVAPVLAKNATDVKWMERRMGESLLEVHADEDANTLFAEDDLLKYRPAALLWLARQLGSDFVARCHSGMQAAEVAQWMRSLHDKLAQEAGLIAEN